MQEERGVVAPPALAGVGLAVLFRGSRLLDPVQHESRPGERVHVFGERAVEAGHDELGRLGRRVRETEALHPAGRIEVVADHPLDLDALLVANPPGAPGEEARVHDAEDEPAARAEDPEALGHGQVEARPVHQGHEGHHRVEAGAGERGEVGIRGAGVANPQRGAALLVLRQSDHAGGEIHAGHVGAGPREDAGIVPVPASRIEDLAAAQIADERQEGRVVQELAGDIVALPDFSGPRGRVVVPVAGDVLEGEFGIAHRRKRRSWQIARSVSNRPIPLTRRSPAQGADRGYDPRQTEIPRRSSMPTTGQTEARKLHGSLSHPIIDADGHWVEYLPHMRAEFRRIGGDTAVEALDFASRRIPTSLGMSVAERSRRRIGQEAFWFLPTRNTLDRATAMLPRLMYERLDDLGLDFA